MERKRSEGGWPCLEEPIIVWIGLGKWGREVKPSVKLLGQEQALCNELFPDEHELAGCCLDFLQLFQKRPFWDKRHSCCKPDHLPVTHSTASENSQHQTNHGPRSFFTHWSADNWGRCVEPIMVDVLRQYPAWGKSGRRKCVKQPRLFLVHTHTVLLQLFHLWSEGNSWQ